MDPDRIATPHRIAALRSGDGAVAPMAATSPDIEIADLLWRPAGADLATLDLRGVRVTVPPGGLLIVSGVSGSGKSTLLRAIAGLLGTLIPGELQGRLVVGGVDLVAAAARNEVGAPRELLAMLGYVAAGPAPTWALPRVGDDAALPLEARRSDPGTMRRVQQGVAARVGLAPSSLDRSHATLSGGEQARAAALVALAAAPTLLIADEPLLGLDSAAAAMLRNALLSQRATRVIAVHDPSTIAVLRDDGVTGSGDDGSVQLHLQAPVQTQHRASLASPVIVSPVIDRSTATSSNTSPLLSLSGATVGNRAVAPIDLQVRNGDALLLTGPSGAGKSTLIRAAAGTLPLVRGRRTVHAAVRMRVVPQDVGLLLGARSARAQIAAHGIDNDDLERATFSARAIGVEQLLDAPPARCSDGERRRLALVVAVAAAPDVLFVDEPTGGLDDHAAAAVVALLEQVRATGCALVVATHDSRLHLQGERRIDLAPPPRNITDLDAAALLLQPSEALSGSASHYLGATNALTRAAVALLWLFASFAAPAVALAQGSIALAAIAIAWSFGVRATALLRLLVALSPAAFGLVLANLIGGASVSAALGAGARLIALAGGSALFLRPFEPLRLADAVIEHLRAPFAPTMALLATAARVPSMLDEARERRAIRRLSASGSSPLLLVDTFDALVRGVPLLALALEVRGVRLPTRSLPPTRLRSSRFGRTDLLLVVVSLGALLLLVHTQSAMASAATGVTLDA